MLGENHGSKFHNFLLFQRPGDGISVGKMLKHLEEVLKSFKRPCAKLNRYEQLGVLRSKIENLPSSTAVKVAYPKVPGHNALQLLKDCLISQVSFQLSVILALRQTLNTYITVLYICLSLRQRIYLSPQCRWFLADRRFYTFRINLKAIIFLLRDHSRLKTHPRQGDFSAIVAMGSRYSQQEASSAAYVYL